MKRLMYSLALLPMLILLCFCGSSMTAQAKLTVAIYGDVNADEIVDAEDALLVLKAAARLYELDQDQIIKADMNGDFVVDANDALIILKQAAKLDM